MQAMLPEGYPCDQFSSKRCGTMYFIFSIKIQVLKSLFFNYELFTGCFDIRHELVTECKCLLFIVVLLVCCVCGVFFQNNKTYCDSNNIPFIFLKYMHFKDARSVT